MYSYQSVVPCPVANCCFLTSIQISQEQVRWSGIPISFRIFHSLLWFTQSKLWHSQSIKQKYMFFWNSLAFFDDPPDVGNLNSGSSAFSKSTLTIWTFTVHILLKPGLENFEHYFASVWDECNRAVVWAFFGIAFWGIGMKTDLFQCCSHCWVFQICWHIECSTFTTSSFRIWNSSTGIPSPPLALSVVILPKAHLTSHSRINSLMIIQWKWEIDLRD